MQTKTLLTLFAGSFLLLGCTGADQYPVTGQAIGPEDQVRYMVAPDVMPR